MNNNTSNTNKSVYDDYDLGFGNKPTNTSAADTPLADSTLSNPYKRQKQLQQAALEHQVKPAVFGKMATKEEQYRDLKKVQDEKEVTSWDNFIYFMTKRPLFSISAFGLLGSFLSGIAAVVFRKNFSDVNIIWSNSISFFKISSIATFAYYVFLKYFFFVQQLYFLPFFYSMRLLPNYTLLNNY